MILVERWRGTLYIKGVTVRFGFDVLELRKLKQIVKNKATGTPHGMFIYVPQLVIVCRIPFMGIMYILISVGLSTLLVSTIWAMRRPLHSGTSDRTGSTFLYVCM